MGKLYNSDEVERRLRIEIVKHRRGDQKAIVAVANKMLKIT
ncbi:MAG: hypothetical protein ACLP5V_03950 [Candidatus Bathyarchaeia archaeon]